jgi:Domain of unknown function (DUF4386)
MTTAMNVGRTAGALLIAQMTAGYVTNFVLLQPAIDPPGFLVNAAPHAMRVGAAALLGIVGGAFSLAIAITVLPILRKLSERMALTFLALSTVALSLAVVENAKVMSLLSLSQAYAASNGADPASFAGLRGVVAAARNWAHFTQLIVGGSTFVALFATLYRFVLIPRVLAGFAVAAAALQMVTVARPLFGAQVIFPLLAPAGIAFLLAAVWLLVKGFADPGAGAASPAAAADSPSRTASRAPRS